jgi:hypothetical protein
MKFSNQLNSTLFRTESGSTGSSAPSEILESNIQTSTI